MLFFVPVKIILIKLSSSTNSFIGATNIVRTKICPVDEDPTVIWDRPPVFVTMLFIHNWRWGKVRLESLEFLDKPDICEWGSEPSSWCPIGQKNIRLALIYSAAVTIYVETS
jgi:hypothetical protein